MCFINIHITKRKLSNHRLCYFLADKQSFRSTFRAQFVEAKKWLRSDNQRRFIRGMSKMAVIRVLLVNSDIYLCGSSIDYCSNLFCQVCLRHYEQEFIELACNCPVVVCCRCSPQQKADIVTLLKKHTGKRTCAIGEIINEPLCIVYLFGCHLYAAQYYMMMCSWTNSRFSEVFSFYNRPIARWHPFTTNTTIHLGFLLYFQKFGNPSEMKITIAFIYLRKKVKPWRIMVVAV